MAPMNHPKTSASKKGQSPLKQATLAFKTTKRGAAASLKTKAKAKSNLKSQAKYEAELEADGDNERIIVDDTGSGSEEETFLKRETLDMQDKSGKYTKYYKEVKEKMGRMSPIHTEGQTKVHQMLRVFDNTYDYGPCVGMTRLERWERAEALGLNPPAEVRDILLTEQGCTDEVLVHPVFFDQVL